MEINEIAQHRQFATPILSPAVYTDSYEWKLGVRMYLNGVEGGNGRYVSAFVHMMEGEYDDLLDWPFVGRITLSILDQSGARYRTDISRIVQAKPNLMSFKKPIDTVSSVGYGFEMFASIADVFGPSYVKNDKLFLKIEFSF